MPISKVTPQKVYYIKLFEIAFNSTFTQVLPYFKLPWPSTLIFCKFVQIQAQLKPYHAGRI